MPCVCTICSHPQRAKIEAALVQVEPNLRIAARFQVPESVIRRHVAEHFHATLARARDALEITRGDELLEQVKTVRAKTWAVLAKAVADQDHPLTLKALAGLDARLTLLAKLMSEFPEQGTPRIAEARLAEEVAVGNSDPQFWLRCSPGKDRPGQPGWTVRPAQNDQPHVTIFGTDGRRV
jgi:hypothetical protein